MNAADLANATGGRALPPRVPEEVRVEVSLDRMVPACAMVAALPGARLATMVAEDERDLGGAYRLTWTFATDGAAWRTIEAVVPADDPRYPTVTLAVPAANWYEREAHDLMGLVPVGHPDPRRLVHHDDWPAGAYPLRRDFDPADPVPRVPGEPYRFHTLHGDGIVEIPVGPIHAGVIEPGHFRFAAVGEVVLHLEARLFYTHRGIEKTVEGRTPDHVLQVAERICGACSTSHAVSYALAVERVAGVVAPPRAQAIRTITLELERLYNHVGDLGNMCAGIGFAVGAMTGARLKDDLQRLNERVTGSRFLRGMVALGGVRRDLDPGMVQDIRETLGRVAGEFGDFMAMLWASGTAVDRFERTGVLSPVAAHALGAVGVAARASGLAIDARVDQPHLLYGAFRPAVVTRTAGDARARAEVRMDEVVASLALVHDLLAALPDGPLRVPVVMPAGGGSAFAVTESPRGENLHWVRIGDDGLVRRLRVRSASFPNWPAVAASVPGNMVPDFPTINKSFELCYACLDR